MLTRRAFLRATLSLTAAAAATSLYAWKIEPHWVETVHLPLSIRHLPLPLAGKTVMQISDIHIGRFVDSSYLIDTLQTAQTHQPDYVLYTGDFVSYDSAAQFDQLDVVMAYAPHGRLGTAAVLGNHDYAHGWSDNAVAQAISDRLGQLGIRVLRNECLTLEGGLQIMGVDDFWSTNFQPELALAAFDASQPTIALCHNPDAADLSFWGSYDGWILSGHTHGGQCKPPFLPPPILPVHNARYSSGIFDVGGRTLYINRGLGHFLPVRFNVRPEITLFTLTSA